MPNHPKTIVLEKFQGLNNVLPPERTDPAYLKEAMNVDIDKSGGIQKREGYGLVSAGVWTALWSNGTKCLGVQDSELVSVGDTLDVDTLGHLVGTAPVAFAHVDGKAYYVSDTVTGVVNSDNSLSTFGIGRPMPTPTVQSTSAGSLTAGVYQIVLTYVDSDGNESGAGVAQLVRVGNDGSISITGIPVSSDTRVVSVRIYCSTPDGEVLYFNQSVSNGTTTATISQVGSEVLPLKSFNISPPPNGHIIRYSHSRLWIANDNILWYSEPFSYEWFNYQSNFFPFPERIRAVMPVPGGIWIASDRLYYLAGKDPAKSTLEEKEPVRIVEGTDRKIVGAYVFFENTPIGYKWLVTTNKGVYVCFNDGVTLNMTERNVSYPEADKGTGVFIQKEGINRYLSILQKRAGSDNTKLGDQVTAVVIRNGIPIQ